MFFSPIKTGYWWGDRHGMEVVDEGKKKHGTSVILSTITINKKNWLLWNWAFEDIKRKGNNTRDYVSGSGFNPGEKNWGFSTGS